MASRTVAVRLTLENNSYIAGIKQASAATRDLSGQIAKEAGQNKQAWTEVGQGLLAFGAIVGVGVGMAVKRFADFDQSMSNVKAATHESAAAMGQLRDAALEAGARTAFSATEAAGGIEALAKAGISTQAILSGGLNGALDLAAAGGLGVADAAEIAATAMTQFGLEGSKVPHVADLLAAAAGKAQGDVSDMGMALKQAGLVANQTGLTIEETTAGLASFASAGLIGSDAGTSFKSMLQRLTPQSAEAAGEMDRLGISAYDAQGNFIGLEAFAANLQSSLSGLTVEQRNSALATIFGSDAVRAAAVLYEQGGQGIADWTAKVNDQGYAAETAATRLDNLKGDVEALGGSLETALIGAGSGANGVLRELTQGATGAVNAFSALPGPAQQGVLGVAAVTAAVALAGGAMLVAVPKVASFRAALGDMGPGTQRLASGLGSVTSALGGPLGIALAVGTVALGVYGAKKAEARAEVEQFTEAIKADSGALGENTRQSTVAALEKRGVLEAAEGLGVSLEAVTSAVMGESAALQQVNAVLDEHIDASFNGEQAMGTQGEQALKLQEAMNGVSGSTQEASDVARREAEALGEQTAATGPASEGLTAVGAAAAAAAPPIAELTEEQKALGQALTSFVDPLGVYTELLSEKEAAERESAEESAAVQNKSVDDQIAAVRRDYDARLETARATGEVSKERIQQIEDERDAQIEGLDGQKKGWEDFTRGVSVSLDQYAAKLEEKNQAARNWQANLVKVAGIAGVEVANHLASLGIEGVDLTAKFANGTTTEVARAKDAIIANIGLAREGAERELQALVVIGGSKGKMTADAIATQVGIGADRVRELAALYGVNLAGGLNPVLVALGRPGILAGGTGAIRHQADGGVVDFYAQGGVSENHVAQIARPGDWRVWAEPETGGEAYIPLAPAKRERSVDIWQETGRRLGVQGFADGGFFGGGCPQCGGGMSFADGGLVGFGRMLQGKGFRVAEHPAFGGVCRGCHSKNSLHYSGQAIDVNWAAGTSAAEQEAIDKIVPMAKGYGLRTIWRVEDHFNHAHFDTGGNGSLIGSGGSLGPAFPSSLPKPPVPDPFRAPISTTVSAAMEHVYQAAEAARAQANAQAAALDSGARGGAAPLAGGGNAGANRELGQRALGARGWGAQWGALNNLWSKESGWNNLAQNPTSTAYGIPQFLNSTWAGTGIAKTSNPGQQIEAGLRYIAKRYRDPSGAWSFWQRNRWYGDGGIDMGAHTAMASGGVIREPVVGLGMRSGGSYSFGERGPETVRPGVHSFADGGWVRGTEHASSPSAAPAGPTLNVQVSADAGLARTYAEQVAARVVTKQRDALAAAGVIL